jgi:hypothetical protein
MQRTVQRLRAWTLKIDVSSILSCRNSSQVIWRLVIPSKDGWHCCRLWQAACTTCSSALLPLSFPLLSSLPCHASSWAHTDTNSFPIYLHTCAHLTIIHSLSFYHFIVYCNYYKLNLARLGNSVWCFCDRFGRVLSKPGVLGVIRLYLIHCFSFTNYWID